MGPDRHLEAAARAEDLRERAAEIDRQLARLRSGSRDLGEDLEGAELAAEAALRASAEAHTRAAAALRRTAEAHRDVANSAELLGEHVKAEQHRAAADAIETAAQTHDRAAEADRPRFHRS